LIVQRVLLYPCLSQAHSRQRIDLAKAIVVAGVHATTIPVFGTVVNPVSAAF
jgi:hypothetical protein